MSRRVAIVVDGLGLSGKTKALVDLACGLDPARYEASVCCFQREASVLVPRLAQRGVEVHEVVQEDGLSLRAVSRLARVLRSLRPDVVHCYNPRPMLYGGLAARALGIRAVVGSLSAFACQVPDRDYEFLPQRLFTRSYKNRLRNRVAAGLSRRIQVVSRKLGERFCRYNGISADQLRVISYGVAIDHAGAAERRAAAPALRREMGASDDDVLVGSVGRLVEQKDYPTQLRGFAAAAAEEPRLRMALVGDGPLRASLEALSSELGIRDRVVFLGHRADVPRLLGALDVFVIASKFEPYGVALLEAKGAGLTIVATAVNEVPEIIADGETGLLARPGDPSDLGRQLARVARSAELRRRLGAAALLDARERHSIDAMLSGYHALYDEVTAAR